MTILLFVHFFSGFRLEVTCSIHVFYLLYPGKRRQSRKHLIYYMVFKEKQLRFEKYFYCIFIIAKGTENIINTFNNSFLYYLFSDFNFIWQYFTPSQFSIGLLHWWAFMLLHAFIKTHVWLILIRFQCLTWWVWLTNITLVDVLGITSISYLQG